LPANRGGKFTHGAEVPRDAGSGGI